MTEEQLKQLRERSTHYDNGLNAPLNDEEILTIVLCPAGKPTKRMAHIAQHLVNTSGLQGLAQELVNAPIGLMRFGLTRQEVNQLTIAYEFFLRCHLLTDRRKRQIKSADDAAEVFRPEMMHLDHEEMHAILLDSKHQLVEYVKQYKGTINATSVRAAEIFRPAILRNCSSIIIAHNHPSGLSQTSLEDRDTTLHLVEAGKVLDIELLDHIIIGNPSFTSLRGELKW
jgi:DNA repair protein RadC